MKKRNSMKQIFSDAKLRIKSIILSKCVDSKSVCNSKYQSLELFKLCFCLILLTMAYTNLYSNSDSNSIKIGGSFDYPPYSFIDDNGKPAGFSVDLSKAVGSILHKKIDLKLESWGDARNNLEYGNTNLIHDIVYSPERCKVYSFTKPYHISSYAVFAKNGSPKLKSISDLNNKKIITIKGDIGIDFLRDNGIKATVQTIPNYKDLIVLLENSDYQYAMLDQLVGYYWINKLDAEDVYCTSLSLFKMKYCFASSVGDKELALEIDGAMSILVQNKKYEEIYSKWMSQLDPHNKFGWNLLKQYYWIPIAIISLFLIMFIWSITLRRKIARKTLDLERTNKSLIESKERFQSLLNANPDLMFMFDINRKFVDFHGGVDTLLYPPDMFVGKSIWDVLPKYLADYTDKQLELVFTTGEMQVYEYQLEAQNKLRDYECRLVLSGDYNAISIVRDITERKYNEVLLQRQNQELEAQYEEYLQLNEVIKQSNDDLMIAKANAENGEKELASLMTNLPGLVYRCLDDENWTMKFVSDGALSLTGYLPEELIDNKLLSYNELIHPDDRELVDRLIHNALSKNKYFIIDYRIIDKTGKIKFVWERGHKMPSADGGSAMLQGFITDISDRKFAEETLQRQNQELEAQYEEYIQLNEILRRTNTDLEMAKAKAEESDKLKTAFLQNMSHEIRTPLNGIIGYSSMLGSGNIPFNEIEMYATIIQQSGNRLIEIVNNILDISKIETGQIEIQKQLVSLNSVIRDVYNFFLQTANQKNLSISYSTDLDNKDCIIQTDEMRINQILTNLIANAIKFTQKGTIEFGYSIADSMVIFFVKDTGIGISPENIALIFERFSQIDLSISRGFEGAGLGLAISKGLVELLGGTIWLESEIGKGTTFFFSTPYSANIQNEFNLEKNREGQVANNTLNKLKILVAEDDEISESLISIVVRKISRETLIARNGIEAVEICRNNPDIDLVLMDVKMPKMSGIEATKLIREFNTKIIIIAQTAYAFNSEREMIMSAGCNEYISKPIEISKLSRLIDKHRIDH